jgi:hypothetical protein
MELSGGEVERAGNNICYCIWCSSFGCSRLLLPSHTSGYYKLLDLLRRRRRRSLGASPSATTVAQRTSARQATSIVQEHFARAITIVQEHRQEELPSLRIIGEPVRA